MPKYRIEVSFKQGVLDTEGEAAQSALKSLGFSVARVAFVKTYLLESNESKARVEEMCRQLLANEVIQDYSVQELS